MASLVSLVTSRMVGPFIYVCKEDHSAASRLLTAPHLFPRSAHCKTNPPGAHLFLPVCPPPKPPLPPAELSFLMKIRVFKSLFSRGRELWPPQDQELWKNVPQREGLCFESPLSTRFPKPEREHLLGASQLFHFCRASIPLNVSIVLHGPRFEKSFLSFDFSMRIYLPRFPVRAVLVCFKSF